MFIVLSTPSSSSFQEYPNLTIATVAAAIAAITIGICGDSP